MTIPPLALLLSFWLHMLATVVWLGSLAALAIFILPSMRRSLKPADYANGVVALNRKLDPLGWFSLGLLTFTGLLQMDSSPSYEGLFVVANAWSVAMCAKHIVFLGMIAVSGYLTWSVAPALQTAALRRAGGKRSADDAVLRRFQLLIVANLVLGVLVLVFTALARVS
jgi:uncharacterized membrane protein